MRVLNYRLHEINDREFARLVVPGIQPSAEGPDGGRDGKFHGTAALSPSTNDSLSSNLVLRAKHIDEAEVSSHFMPALNFLYLLGRVGYHTQNSTIEYRSG